MTQRSIARSRRLRIAAGMNSAAATSSPCASIMRSTVSYMTCCSPLKLAIGRCASRKRFSMSAALICCTQISSKRCTRVLSSDVCCEHDAVAALVAAELVRAPRLGEQRIEPFGARADLGEADRAGHRQRVVRALEDALGDARERVLRPRFDVAQRAALEEHREDLAAETAVEIVRLRELAQLLGDLHQHVLARERPDLLLELAELVGPNVSEHAHAAACRRRRADRSRPRGSAGDGRTPSSDPCARPAR